VKLLVGLGNPGRAYQETRHNLGFQVIDLFARDNGIPISKKKFNAQFGSGRFESENVLILKPSTYMNRSGIAVSAFVDFYRLGPDDLVVSHDDVDLPLGRIRLRGGGGDGGHKGVRSVIEWTGSADFTRLRMGGGRPEGLESVEHFVLQPFRKDERAAALSLAEQGARALEVLLVKGRAAAMNEFNPA